MNRIYRLVWNRVTNAWVCCAENAKGRGKTSGVCGSAVRRSGFNPTSFNSVGLKPDLRVTVLAASLALIGTSAFAAPVGGQISAGSGAIAQINTGSGLNTTINQISQNLAINWQSFGIAANESVRFNQPNVSAIALNRVTGQNPSAILGSLSANGQVFVLNPNGVLFGAGSQVNVGGLVASTLSLSDADFMAGKTSFSGTGGSVVNQGNLTAAQGGYIALLAPEVRNEGVISATLGTAVLAAGDKVTLNLNNGSLVSFTIDQGALNALADNKQLIQADGGQVFMSAKAADALSSAVVNNTGVIQARTIQNVAGVIKLIGDMQVGTVNVGGTLDASAPEIPSSPPLSKGGTGGFIETSAAHVHVANDVKVTTLASNGLNGTWLIDPVDFTIAASGGDMTGAALSASLAGGNVTIQSTLGASGTAGDVNVNDAVTWAVNTLTLNAQNNININAVMDASLNVLGNGPGAGILALQYGQGAVAAGNTSNIVTGVNGSVLLPASTTNFTTLQGSDGVLKNYTVITSLGAAGSATQTDLQGMNGNSTLNYALGANIDATGTNAWNSNNAMSPTYAGFAPITGFSGTFDGLGHTITGLTINRNQSQLGLFGDATQGSVIRNVGLVGGSVNGQGAWTVGGLVGSNYGTISNSYNTGTVSSIGGGYIGGLVGYGDGTISNSYTTGSVSGSQSVGGLVGRNGFFGTVNNSYHTTGSVTGTNNTGGLVGSSSGPITNSFYEVDTVAINGAHSPAANGIYASQFGAWQAGGLVALNVANYFTNISGNNYSISTVQNMQDLLAFTGNAALTFTLAGNIDLATAPTGFYIPTWTGTFDGANNTLSNFTLTSSNGNIGLFGKTAAGSHINNLGLLNVNVSGTTGNGVGGLVGSNYGTISNSYTTGSVSSTTGGKVGGLVGYGVNGSVINSSHSSATVSSTSGNNVGGLVGDARGNIDTSYATGNVSSTSGGYVGGLAGYNNNGTISNSYHTTGSVTGANNVGGLVGQGGTITNSFYDLDAVAVNGAHAVGPNGIYTTQFGDWQTGGFAALNPVTYFGAATAANTYTLTGVQGLKDLLGFMGNAALTFNLAGNIDMAAAPVGFYIPTWAGTFDGANHTISNFALNDASGTGNIGFFGRAAAGSQINNLGLLNVNVTGSTGNNVGGLVGYEQGTISNSYTTGSVSSTTGGKVGGLVGYGVNGSVINSSHSSATVSNTSGGNIGGLVGYGYGTINNSYATGNVSSTSGSNIGGLMGYGNSNSVIETSYATGNVSSTTGGNVGGLVGGAGNATINNSYASGSVSGINNLGGLTGYGSHTGTNSHYNIETAGLAGVTAGGLYATQFNSWVNGGLALNIANYYTANGAGFYQISSLQGLKDLLGFADINNAAYKFVLTTNLDMASLPGYSIPVFAAPQFDGGGMVLNNFTLNNPTADLVGFIGTLGAGSTVSNLGLTNVNVTGHYNVGALVGFNNGGTINNSYATGTVTSAGTWGGNTGGLVGFNNGVWDSVNSVYTGGTINNSYAAVTVNSGANGRNVGGLVGYGNNATISNSYATGAVNGQYDNVGGLAGNLRYTTLTNNYATGIVTVTSGNYVGGLLGLGYGSNTTDNYATGAVTGVGEVGGLFGRNQNGSIANSYATGSVSGSDTVGGLVGFNYGGSATISTSYATGLVTGASNVGGLAGTNANTITNSFFDSTVNSTRAVAGFNAGTTPGSSGLTTTQMYAQASFVPAATGAGNWDFTPGTGTWAITEGVSNPQLLAATVARAAAVQAAAAQVAIAQAAVAAQAAADLAAAQAAAAAQVAAAQVAAAQVAAAQLAAAQAAAAAAAQLAAAQAAAPAAATPAAPATVAQTIAALPGGGNISLQTAFDAAITASVQAPLSQDVAKSPGQRKDEKTAAPEIVLTQIANSATQQNSAISVTNGGIKLPETTLALSGGNLSQVNEFKRGQE